MNHLSQKNNYTSTIKYIKNTIITEYDMESAGLNILTELGYFSEDERNRLLSINKLDRNIIIGKLLRNNPKMVEDLENGFTQARKIFFEKNNIDEYDVISIKRDAIFIIGNKKIDSNISKYVRIRPKNRYSSYLNIMGYENYYNRDTDKLDVKKYTKEVEAVHKDFLLKDLKEILRNSELGLVKENFIKLAVLKDKMVSYNLDKEYYFDIIRSSYLIRSMINGSQYSVNDIEDSFVKEGLLSYNNNLRFILEIIENVL